jgi:4-hydroxybenzoate polyprenyltransferase
MYTLEEFGMPTDLLNFNFLTRVGLTDTYFILLITSVVLIAASGNIINDYFDQKADRVNKPDRLIIDKYIKRRWAIILNWTFNGIGFLIAFYLSYQLENWWILTVSFLSINLLYFYSAVYKRKFLSGNLIVAFLTAIVPLYVFIYGAFSNFGNDSPFGLNDQIFIADNILAIITYSAFAFFLNLIREIIKDMADVKGDLLLQSQSFPIRFGFAKTKTFIGGLYVLVLGPLVYYVIDGIFIHPDNSEATRSLFLYLLLFVILALIVSLYITFTRNRPKSYLLSSNFIKIAMLFGVISALFYA